MIRRVVALALGAPLLVVALAVLLVAGGLWAYGELDIEAYPDPVEPTIEVIAQPSGWSAEEVERSVTLPLENALNGMPGLDHLRSQSLFGLSDVKCYFHWGTDYVRDEQNVLNRLTTADLPPGIRPALSPESAVGEIFRYQVVGAGHTLADLKTAQDWILEKQFRRVPGVVDVTGFGGLTKQIHVDVDPYRLRGQGATLAQLLAALPNANQNVGGERLTLGEQSFNVRGIGLMRSIEDVENVVLTSTRGTPVRVRDVATVRIGNAPRLGIVGRDADPDVVEGVVLMRKGGASLKTLAGVHTKVEEIRRYHLLPPGMDLVPFYDREDLVHVTTRTVLENLALGILLVTAVLWLFLGSAKASLLTAVNIPLALLAAFLGMVATGTPANLISLGAVDFGIVVDSTVIMVENVFRHLGPHKGGTTEDRIREAAGEVGSPLFYSTLIIAVAFIPLFTLQGVAGVIFSPMAHTYAFAIGGALALAMTLTPVAAARALRSAQGREEEEATALMRRIEAVYRPLFAFALAKPRRAALLAALPVAGVLLAFPLLGGEFMPKLEEGNFWIRATLPTSISLEASAHLVGRMRAIVLGCPRDDLSECREDERTHPEVTTVVSQLGRPDDGTDVAGFNNIELLAPLKPPRAWRRGVGKEALAEEISGALERAFPGVVFNFSQAIGDNVEEAMSGVKGENTVKVVGPDLELNEESAARILETLSGVRGVVDPGRFPSLGQPDLRITPDRALCARYGLNVGDVEGVIQAALGGTTVTQVYDGERHVDLVVRWAPRFRRDRSAIRSLLLSTPDGGQIPLGQVARVEEREGPSVIYREDNHRYAPVKFSVRGRDLASTIEEAQRTIARSVPLPYDTHLEWAGEINQLTETTGRLRFILPLSLLLIALLVYLAVGDGRDALIVLAGIPVASSGGVAALLLTRTNFSISAAMGFVSLFGIAIQDALIVVTYARSLWEEGHGIQEGARRAAVRGLRPALLAASVAMLGLLPAALSRGIGSETQKPLAIVVIGGALALVVLPRLLQPALLVLAHARDAEGREEPS